MFFFLCNSSLRLRFCVFCCSFVLCGSSFFRIVRFFFFFFFFQAEDGIRDTSVTGVQTCALPIFAVSSSNRNSASALVSSVLPTPVGPRNRNEPIGRLGSCRPARARRTALDKIGRASCRERG